MRRRSSKPAELLTPGLRRLGLATPPAFVGRERELSAIAQALRESRTLVVHGAVGSGKTRLARELEHRPDVVGVLTVTYVRCRPQDRAAAVCARAERALAILPGSLGQVLRERALLLVIDDAHHLPAEDAVTLVADFCSGHGDGRVMLLTRDVLPLRRDRRRFAMNLDGLDEVSARELWTHHEEIYGPTPASACDEAVARTRGMPLALRREYARARFDERAWDISELPVPVRHALEAVAVLGIPAAPAAVAAVLADGDKPEPALIDLVSRQLIDPVDDGRFAIHDVVRDEVLDAMGDDVRVVRERSAAALVSSVGRGFDDQPRMAWDAGDDGALGLLDPVDRMREAVRHLVAAGDVAAAAARLIADRDLAVRHGGGGEVLALVDLVDDKSREHGTALAGLRAAIAARHGRVAEALEVTIGTTQWQAREGFFGYLEVAELQFRAGDVAVACARLEELCESPVAEQRCRAAALLAEIEICRGDQERAEAIASAAFERDRAAVSGEARARLHVALATIEQHAGRVSAARAALSRAASSGRIDPALAALIESRRAMCLVHEGRISEAEAALAEAEKSALEVDAPVVCGEIRRCAALVDARRGNMLAASDVLSELVTTRRQRGDEIGALEAELDLADILSRRGELAAASELAAACRGSAARRQLSGLAARAELIGARIELGELRLKSASSELRRLIGNPAASTWVRGEAMQLSLETEAWLSGKLPRSSKHPAAEIHDEIDKASGRAALAMAAGDCGVALDAANTVAVRAERAGRRADAAAALALVARLLLARGDRAAAGAAGARAAREALSCGSTRARVNALMVLAALARDDEDIPAAFTYAQDAAKLALEAGLPVERLAAAEAIDAIAGASPHAGKDVRNAAAATMSQPALDAAARILADLGLTTVRPFRLVSATGQESFVADANPDLLRFGERDLAVDGVREVVYRNGSEIANLRRRSLLKRLLFLFAGYPGRVYSKEEIVETVWNVEYHPLRHDAALFTNIMRIRRLLGKDGAELIRVSEDGYRFVPPKDFLFVDNAPAS